MNWIRHLKKYIYSVSFENYRKVICIFGIKIKYIMEKYQNKIIVHKENGKIVKKRKVKGLNIKFCGKNSTVELWEPISFIGSTIIINNNCKVEIKNSLFGPMHRLIICMAYAQDSSIYVGENFSTNGTTVEMSGVRNLSVNIGNDCMFSNETILRVYDSHTIYDIETKEPINYHSKGINIGNRVWLGQYVIILKNVTIADNTVVGIGSIVTKSFDKSNCIIAGIPAKIVKEKIDWHRVTIERFAEIRNDL